MFIIFATFTLLISTSSPPRAQETLSAKSDSTAGVSSAVLDVIRNSRDTTKVASALITIHNQILYKEALPRVYAVRKALQAGATSALAAGDSVFAKWLLGLDDQYGVYRSGAALPWFMRQPPPLFYASKTTKQQVRFFIFGDWGHYNQEQQQAVAAAVRAEHRKNPFLFGMTTGDNFYPGGIESPMSPRWQAEYESQYGVMNIPVYVTLGNHDYYSNPSPAAEILYTQRSKTWRLPATHYTFMAGSAQFFVIDSEQLSQWQLLWLDSALTASKATWKIVVGHHDIYSNRRDGTDEKGIMLIPILKRHRVPVYLNGHYHTLQHHQVDGIDYVTSGAGGRGVYALYDADSLSYRNRRRFAAKSYGFGAVDITPTIFRLRFINQEGKEIYRYERKR